jgi:hypothetical protein
MGFMLTTMISFAQVKTGAETAHLIFNGIPIDGSLTAFVSKMEKNGFTKVDSDDGYALLAGEYLGRKSSSVEVETVKNEDVVSKVAVMFPPCDTWSSLSADYSSLKAMLTESYGKPSGQVEKFRGASQPVDDASKMAKVKSDNSEFYTTYETPSGSIQLSIEHDSSQKCFVMLAYYDKINGQE